MIVPLAEADLEAADADDRLRGCVSAAEALRRVSSMRVHLVPDRREEHGEQAVDAR